MRTLTVCQLRDSVEFQTLIVFSSHPYVIRERETKLSCSHLHILENCHGHITDAIPHRPRQVEPCTSGTRDRISTNIKFTE